MIEEDISHCGPKGKMAEQNGQAKKKILEKWGPDLLGNATINRSTSPMDG